MSLAAGPILSCPRLMVVVLYPWDWTALTACSCGAVHRYSWGWPAAPRPTHTQVSLCTCTHQHSALCCCNLQLFVIHLALYIALASCTRKKLLWNMHLILYTVPKVIDFPRYKMKYRGENVILRGIFHVVFHFPLKYLVEEMQFMCMRSIGVFCLLNGVFTETVQYCVGDNCLWASPHLWG